MVFLHIDAKNYNKKNSNQKTPIDEFNKHLDNNNPIFALIYMEHCGPCMATRPEWNKIKNALKSNNNNEILIVDIDKDILDKIPKLKVIPSGFPTIAYIKSQDIESYEDSSIQEKNRTVDSFIEWIESKTNTQGGGKLVGAEKMVGGIKIVNPKDINNFHSFIEKSTLQFLTSGSNGVTFTATFNDLNASSPYTYMDSSHYGMNVTSLLIKFVFVTDNDIIMDAMMPLKHINSRGKNATIEVRISDPESFKNEVNIQTDILLKTMNYLSPICPSLVYADILSDPTTIQNLLNQILSMPINETTKDKIQSIKNNLTRQPSIHIGIIGMELLSDSMTLNAALNDDSLSLKNKKTLVNMCLYLLLKLAIDTGYTHSDFHIANLMMDLNDSTYFDGLTGKPSLIDFGFTQKLSPEIFNTIKTKCNAKQYTEALKELCEIKRPDGLNMYDYISHYGWVCGAFDIIANESVSDFDPEVNAQLIELFDLREKAIDKVVQLFNEKHEQDKSIPLLPLSNDAKKYMFSGLIGGRKNKGKTRKNKSKHKKNKSRKNKSKRRNKKINRKRK